MYDLVLSVVFLKINRMNYYANVFRSQQGAIECTCA